jgi:zinc/manganese transport system ATP-binding protein
MTSETLSELYRTEIHVIKHGDHYVVVGEHLEHPDHTYGHAND